MNVSGVGTTSPYTAAQASQVKQTRKDFQGLGDALSSGDLSSAQSALAGLVKDVQTSGSTSGQFGSNSQANKDFQSLQSALQSGDLQGAQSAYSSLQKDLRSVHHHGHHHHHGAQGSGAGNSAAIPAPDTTIPASASSSIDTLV